MDRKTLANRGVLTTRRRVSSEPGGSDSAGKTITRTIRIDHGIDEELARIASDESISVNSVISRALRKYVDWDVYAERFGFTTMPTPAFQKLVGRMSNSEAKEMGRWIGGTLARDFIVFRFKRTDMETAVKALEMLGQKYGKAFKQEYYDDGESHILIINHGLGPVASVFYEEIVRALFGDLLQLKVEMESGSENQIVARIR